MKIKQRSELIEKILNEMYPNAYCELTHRNPFELLVAVTLSAQTTDVAVNKVTPQLFGQYPSANLLATANTANVESIIKTIGLYKNKAKNIIKLSQQIVDVYSGVVPNTKEQLVTLAGVGPKTAEVVLGNAFNIPSFPVDTHVMRVSHRLGLVKATITNPDKISDVLKMRFQRQNWIKLHHQMIFFGRYFCKSKNPDCQNCPMFEICKDKIKFMR